MKIAVFHNFMDNIGGAEMVSLTLARELNADLYTTNIDSGKIEKTGFADVLPRIKSIGKIPRNAPLRQQLALWKFRRLDLRGKYDFFIISGDWAMSGAVNNKPNLWYVHSPLNELWQFKDYIREEILSWWKRPIYDIWVWINRRLTLSYSKYVDILICNSKNTQNRIKKYYNKDAVIIFPPTDISKYRCRQSKNYWLSVNRLITHKRIELQTKAFSKLPDERLIIVGSYEKGARQFEKYKKYIEKTKPANVEIINWADDRKLTELYSECKGFITTAKDEDFGMTAVEAMASGKPVIAPNDGGYKESVINNVTGILIDNIDEGNLKNAIERIRGELDRNQDIYRYESMKRSKIFNKEEFISKIKEQIKNLYEN
ncbi:MAG: glycosyltransferase [Candidatus Paceibacterota bacterium]|jgi:glycosyltransferase involved in cell wall biosynthesis